MTATTFRLDRTPAEVRERFEALAADWKRKAGHWSDTRRMALLPEYQRIIGLGPPAVLLMLEELVAGPEFWFHALEAITGENPAPANCQGDIQAITDAWVEWGRRNNFLPLA